MSEVVLDVPVFCHCLLVMTSLAECLPVRHVPEELFVSSVRNDVVNNRCSDQPSVLVAPRAQRMLVKEHKPCFTPPIIITSFIAALPVVLVECFMLFTIITAVIYQLITVWMFAGCLRSVRHLYSFLHKPCGGAGRACVYLYTDSISQRFTYVKILLPIIYSHLLSRFNNLSNSFKPIP